jgi:hypothetical protein
MTTDAPIPVAVVSWGGSGFTDDEALDHLSLPVAAVLRARRAEAMERQLPPRKPPNGRTASRCAATRPSWRRRTTPS